MKLLTIAIPTFNRAGYLAPLLEELSSQWPAFAAEADLLISNNASTDGTPELIDSFSARFPNVQVVTNARNLGSDGNIFSCFTLARTPFVWILGDDDRPQPGALGQILGILRETSPDLIYMNSTPLEGDAVEALPQAQYRLMDKLDFATRVNVNFTFISAVIVNKALVTGAGKNPIDGFLLGSSLVQLSWVLEALRLGRRFVYVDTAMLRATPANSGGYSVLKVFCVNHTKAVAERLSSEPELAEKIINRTFTGYLPGLIWNVRRAKIGTFELPPPRDIVDPVMTRRWQYWMLLLPIWTAPTWGSWSVFQISRVVRKWQWTLDAARSRKMRSLNLPDKAERSTS